jgi:hypothetical protein
MSITYFNSTKNYLKRTANSGKSTMLGPNSSIYSGYLYQRTTTIAHGLGFVPLCRVYYEPFGNGVIHPIISLPLQQVANNLVGPGSGSGPGLIYWADATNLNIRLYYKDATLAANSYPIYYVIYQDFKVA